MQVQEQVFLSFPYDIKRPFLPIIQLGGQSIKPALLNLSFSEVKKAAWASFQNRGYVEKKILPPQ